MWKCINCQNENHENAANCEKCGFARYDDFTYGRTISKVSDSRKQEIIEKRKRTDNSFSAVDKKESSSETDRTSEKQIVNKKKKSRAAVVITVAAIVIIAAALLYLLYSAVLRPMLAHNDKSVQTEETTASAAVAEYELQSESNEEMIAEYELQSESNEEMIAEYELQSESNEEMVAEYELQSESNEEMVAEYELQSESNEEMIAEYELQSESNEEMIVEYELQSESNEEMIAEYELQSESNEEVPPEYEVQSESNEEMTSEPDRFGFKDADAGDIITFGTYEQDNDTSDGKEPIEWLVIEKEDSRMLVISRYLLDCVPYNEKYAAVTWENCTLRTWLNDTFFNAAFNEAEQAVIAEAAVTADNNSEYGTDAGNDTQDKVFLLSSAQADNYFGSDADRQCKPTAYAAARGTGADSDGNGWWWLRSPGYNQTRAASVYSAGSVRYYGRSVTDSDGGIRPAMWINLEN